MGLLSDIIKIGLGVALGEGATDRSRDRKNNGAGRQNLFGTAVCEYGEHHICSPCKFYSQCTQRGRYKVGS